MVYPTDINRCVVLGVEESRFEAKDSSKCWYLHGWNFDGHSGFGGRFELDGYEGEVAIISKTSKLIKFLCIDRHHSSRKSWGWWTETEELPEPPFLITNRLNTNLIFDGEIKLEFNEYGENYFTKEEDKPLDWKGIPFVSFVLGSTGWFGIITIEPESFHLLAYSDLVGQEGLLNSEMISNFDVVDAMDELMIDEELNIEQFKPFGKITRLIPQPEMSLSSV